MPAHLTVYFFGSTLSGFNCFPKSKTFDLYYSNTVSDAWILDIRRFADKIFYTYVQYGLLTSIEGGREGSCFGISIELLNQELVNPISLPKEIFFEVVETMLEQSVVIAKQPDTGTIGFKVKNLSEAGGYLSKWAEQIRAVVISQFSDKMQPIFLGTGKSCQMHPDTSSEIAADWLSVYNNILVSPTSKVLKSPPEIVSLEAQFQKIIQDLELKVGELEVTNSQLNSKIKSLKNSLDDRDKIIKKIEGEKFNLKGKEPKLKRHKKNKPNIPRVQSIAFKSQIKRLQKTIPFILLFVVILIGSIYYFVSKKPILEDDTNSETTFTEPPPSTKYEELEPVFTPSQEAKEKIAKCLPMTYNDGKGHCCLEIELFLNEAQVRGYKVKNISEFKGLIVSVIGIDISQIELEENTDNFKKVSDMIEFNVAKHPDGVPIYKNRFWVSALNGGNSDNSNPVYIN